MEIPQYIGVFISIPKCASNTIRKILSPNDKIADVNHQTLSKMEKKYNLKNSFVFAFIRHPYSRCISWFNFCQNIKMYSEITFEKWVMDGCKTHWTCQSDTYWGNNLNPLLQYNYISNSNKKIDFVGKLENFRIDMKYIVDKLNEKYKKHNIKTRLTYENIHLNKSDGNKALLTKKIKEKIYHLFKKDFEYFGYSP